MSGLGQRLRQIERAAGQGSKEQPGYITVARIEDLPAALAGLAQPTKVYVGWSPDDWDIESEAGNGQRA